MIALRFQTAGKNQTSPASLRGGTIAGAPNHLWLTGCYVSNNWLHQDNSRALLKLVGLGSAALVATVALPRSLRQPEFPAEYQWRLFPCLWGLWGKVQWFIPPACAFFSSFVLKWKSIRTHHFHFLGQDQSTVAQPAEMTVDQCSLVSWGGGGGLFPWSVPTLCLDSMISPLQLHCVKGVCVFRCNLPLFWRQNDQGLLHATAVMRGGTKME